MINEQYVWLAWASAFLVPWTALYLAFPKHRRVMVLASLVTAPFGLTERLFVPKYWSPPSLFDLAERTGFDIESLIFCFAIGGVGAVLYNVLTGRVLVPLPSEERQLRTHSYHIWALLSPVLTFIPLVLLPWNPIYPGIVAMVIGAFATGWCRRDLFRRAWIGGAIFLVYYLVFLIGLELLAPGYVERVWNLAALSGAVLFGLPIEEFLFAIGFGMYWIGVYEHLTWTKAVLPLATDSPSRHNEHG